MSKRQDIITAERTAGYKPCLARQVKMKDKKNSIVAVNSLLKEWQTMNGMMEVAFLWLPTSAEPRLIAVAIKNEK